MRIAIVDDEEEMREAARRYLAKMLAQYWSKEAAVVQLDLFDSAEALLERFGKQSYDLVLLDICVPGLDGMEAAHRLRAESADAGIIFLTTSEDYLMEGYRVFADGYFLKPLGTDDDAFRAALRHVFARRDQSACVLSAEYNGRALEIPFQKIFYADIEGGRLHIVLKERDFHLSRPFTYEWSAERLLRDKRFLECYHRIIVNMDRIERMEEGVFVLTSGQRLPISRRRQGAVKVAYMQYMLSR